MKRLIFALLLLFAAPSFATASLRILAWPGYVSPEAIRSFEARHDVTVEVTTVHSDDELWIKANAPKGRGFDLIAVNTAELRRYIRTGMLAPIDIKNIPNTRKQTARFRHLQAIPGITSQGEPYAIPYTYSAMGLIYNRQLVTTPPTSMAALWDRRYANQVLAYGGGAHNFSLAALTLGYKDPFHLDSEQFIQVVERLRSLRNNVLKFYSSADEVVRLFRSNHVALIFANYGDQQIRALQQSGADIGYVIPKEGALAWLDCWAILNDTRDQALAEAWINHMLSPEVSGQLTLREGLANTLRDTPTPSMPDSGKLIWLEPVENAEQREFYWKRLLSGATGKR